MTEPPKPRAASPMDAALPFLSRLPPEIYILVGSLIFVGSVFFIHMWWPNQGLVANFMSGKILFSECSLEEALRSCKENQVSAPTIGFVGIVIVAFGIYRRLSAPRPVNN